ncbi:MAG: Nre family DNA repair protein [Candidatus Helarchaeota archaeon]
MVRPPKSKELCLMCKGSRNLCGKPRCPILIKQASIIPIKKIILKSATELQGASPPAFFVGRFDYPKVQIGPMIPPHNSGLDKNLQILDEPDMWFGKSFDEIVSYRSNLIRSCFTVSHVKRALTENKLLSISQEIVMAERPVETEVKFIKAPKLARIELDSHSQPFGPIGQVEQLIMSENPRINKVVEKTVGDTDLKASKGIINLYKEKQSVTKIQRILSAGLLGTKERKLVPTRWSITATDDTISKYLIDKIKYFPEVDKYLLFQDKYLGNNFKILIMPREWRFENLEVWISSIWKQFKGTEPVIMQDYEPYEGRKNYASNVTGAYYAARLAVCEYLYKIKKQGSVLVLREVDEEYIVPLGVWVIRETVRSAMKKQFLEFEDLNSALKYINNSDFKLPIKNWKKKSELIKYISRQKRLIEFFKK